VGAPTAPFTFISKTPQSKAFKRDRTISNLEQTNFRDFVMQSA